MKGIIFPVVLVAVLGIAAGIFFFGLYPGNTMAQEITRCSEATTQLRFSCFRSVIEKHYGEALSAEEYLSKIESDKTLDFTSEDSSYAIFGTNCHTFYHALGDFVASHTEGNIAESLRLGPTRCTSGYMMGFYKRSALKNGFSTEVLSELYRSCRVEEQHSCAHEMGHLLHDKYTVSILETLDRISREEYGLEQPREYQYVTFPKADLNKPFEECRELLPEDQWSYCYQGTGHNLFLFSEFSPEGFKTQFEECSGVIDEANREECYSFLLYRIGINDGATKFLSYDYDAGNAVCEEAVSIIAREDLKEHCYLGIGGGIGLFLESEYPYDIITEENLEVVKQRTLEAADLCLRSEEGYAERCFAGLLGTKFQSLYKSLNVYQEDIEKLLPKLQEGLEVIG